MTSKYLLSFLLLTVPVLAQTITVNETGQLLKNDTPYKAIGVNYVDAFWRVIDDSTNTTYQQGFADLAAEGIPFARIAATPFWPNKLREYQDNRDSYLSRLDAVIESAENNGIGLVMSMFWADFTVPDVAQESRNQWGNPNSKTIAFMHEYNLAVDLPNASTHRPPVVPKLGTPETRSAQDEIDTLHILVAFNEFVKTIRSIDPIRPITNGNSMPRAFAERIRHSSDWAPIDTREQFRHNIALVNPSEMNLISVHLYPDHRTEDRFEKGAQQTYTHLLETVKEVGIHNKQPVFLGEFGASMRTLTSNEEVVQEFDQLLQAIVASKIDLAAVWNFDFYDKKSTSQSLYTITRDNPRGYMLDKIREVNTRLSQSRSQ